MIFFTILGVAVWFLLWFGIGFGAGYLWEIHRAISVTHQCVERMAQDIATMRFTIFCRNDDEECATQ